MRTRGDFSMAIAQLGHIAERACRLWLDLSAEEERRRQVARVAEITGHPLTVGVVDELLEAVAPVG